MLGAVLLAARAEESLACSARHEHADITAQHQEQRADVAQADAILELRLYQLTGLEIDKVRAEYRDLLERIKDLLDILAKEARVLAIIKAELLAIKEKYATPRMTDLVPDEGEIAIEDLIANEGVIITLTHTGLIKRTNISSYRSQHRGGKGVIGMATREGATE